MSGPGLRATLRARRSEFELDATLQVEAGETLALVGPNGAGKSTIVALLSGLVPLDPDLGGSIELDGTVLDDSATGRFVPSPDRHVGVVFQHHLLFDHLSVRDNVAFGLRSRGVGRRASRTAAESLLVRFGLGALGGRRPAQLSGGQAQRVALARALASEPALLLLDEPLSALDVETRRDVRRLLADQLESFPGPAVIITHDPVDAMLLADRVAVVEAGRLTQVGTLDEIRRHPASRYIAALVGTNLLDGIADGSSIDITTETGHHRLTVADSSFVGPVRLTIRPEAVSLHPEPPSGSQRNVWETAVAVVEPLGDTTRITLAAPIDLAIDVTSAAAESLGLAPGTPIWAAVKATEIAVTPV